MNVRFAEPCRDKPLDLIGLEGPIALDNARDGRTSKELRTTCQQDIYIGVFFDGTNNNKYRDTAGFSHSNVARLYEVYPGTPAAQKQPIFSPKVNADGSRTPRLSFPDKPFKPSTLAATEFPYYRKIYIPGVGTPMQDVGDSGKGTQRTGGLVMALLGQARLDWALLQLCNQVHAAVFGTPLEPSVTLDKLYKPGIMQSLIGLTPLLFLVPHGWEIKQHALEELNRTLGEYDRSDFDDLLADYEKRLAAALMQRTRKPALRKIRLSVFGFSRGSAEARAWVNMVERRWGGQLGLAGITLQIDFLGIFDTVASVGLAQSAPYANGHFSWADGTSMVVPGSVRRCVHLVAGFEVRGSFPLDSVCQGEALPPNCKEIVYPGVHSDVGGGYPPGDQGRALGAVCRPDSKASGLSQAAADDSLKLSQISLAQMYREARMAGVPLATEGTMIGPQKINFAIDPQLRKDFNAYVAATRTGTVSPTEGKGDPQFARMYPTETQPRDSIWRIIRRHHGYLLQWRKAMMHNGKGGISHLPGLMQSNSDARFQDAEDFRGAEEELEKEIAFLQDTDPEKYAVLDDPLLEIVRDGVKIGATVASALSPILDLIAIPAPGATQAAMRKLMQEKQDQWDTWLRHDWAGEGTLSSTNAEDAHVLFRNYLHDSRAWFKPLFTTNGQGLAPNDEDWFTLGGREAKKRELVRKANKEIEECRASGDQHALAAAEKKLAHLQQEGQPLIVGGREPYRLWGYLRHRRIYQSGKLVDAGYDARKQVIDHEEEERDQEVQRKRLISWENARHDKEMQRLKAASHRVIMDPHLRQEEKDEYIRSAQGAFERENHFHAEELKRFEHIFDGESTVAAE